MTQSRVDTEMVEGPSPRGLIDEARALEESNPEHARVLLQDARVLARSNHDAAAEAEALYGLARNTYVLGDSEEAFAIALDALSAARRCESPAVEVRSLNLISGVHFDAGNYAESLAQSLVALERARAAALRVDESNLLNTIAAIHHAMRDLDRAIVTYEAALSVSRGEDSPEVDGFTLANMARLRAERKEYLLAISLGEASLALLRDHAPVETASLCADLALMYLEVDDPTRAADYLGRAKAELADPPNPQGVVGVALVEAKLLVRLNRAADARRVMDDALDVARGSQVSGLELSCRQRLYELNKELGDFEAALAHHERLHEINGEVFSRGQDLRIKTLQIAHDTEAARSQAEILRLRTTELEELVRGRTGNLEEFQLSAFQRLAALAEFRDLDAGEHSMRVGELAAAVADELREPTEYVDRIRVAGRLHDIGKLGVPDHVLLKASPLTEAEFELMKLHTVIGARLLEGSASPMLQLAAEGALSHHEWWDGTGYPSGLAGAAIPLSGRIIAVADVYDALISERPYKPAWSPAEAFAYIWAASGSHFEPRVVEAFTRVLARDQPEALDSPTE
jgi:putative two-component system response regulator